MTDQAVLEEQGQDVTAQLQERIRAFTAFYEQHAYLAYNLALRIACEPEAAASAVQRAFLTQLDATPPGLLPSIARAALDEARSRPDPRGAGDTEAEALMATNASLPPPERAALALADLAHAGPGEIASSLGLPPDQAGKLLHRAREGFAACLGVPRPQADEAARTWMWAAPPNAVWEELYPHFHRTAERQVRRGAGELTLVLTPAETSASAQPAPARRRRVPRVRMPARRRGSRRRPRWSVIAASAVVLALGGAAAARLTTQGSSGAPSSPQSSAGAVPAPGASGAAAATPSPSTTVSPHKPLTPAELDKLRLQELGRLSQYTKRQANQRLPMSQRNAAARGIADLQRAADERMKAELKREQALRDQLARARAKSNAPPPPPPPSSRPPTPAPRSQPTPQPTAPSGAPKKNKPQTQQTCLFNQDTGQYVCPQ